ncbi:hypothetical protein BS47DRAFT_1012053 [Hydnum rufescens UP504]|uniref:Mediator complex subunit 16 C-terminal domain-containing protein n=1 Tax=Hydnum rufescens UP504 TaxID=1448309 RepID=A0A9P6AX87_9AGAM|nr:hypothetical protein BS47DRAFT_1012053 [Hydnum rufescens UP504]
MALWNWKHQKAHSTRPLIQAQLIPASPNSRPVHKFDLAPPPLVSGSPAYYAPPICIAASPQDDCLFAFFPPSAINIEGGISCVWERGQGITAWKVKDSWKSERGNDVVASRWLGDGRQWSYNAASKPELVQSPPLGPRTLGTPTLILVMQLHEVQLHVHTPFATSTAPFFNHLRAPLRQPAHVFDVDVHEAPFITESHGGYRVCRKASIGISYSEPSVLIATHCTIVPTFSNPASSPFSLDFDTSPLSRNSDRSWDDFGEENTVDICQIQFDVFSNRRSLTTTPLFSTSISSFSPWSAPQAFHPSSPTQVRCLSLFTAPFRSPTVPSRENVGAATCGFTLVVAYSSHYGANRQSHLRSWTIRRMMPSWNQTEFKGLAVSSISDDGVEDMEWAMIPGAERILETGVSVAGFNVVSDGSAFFMSLAADPRKSKHKGKLTCVADIRRLRVADLSDDAGWEPASVWYQPKHSYSLMPTSCVLSPNQALICSRGEVFPTQRISIIPSPRRSDNEVAPLSSVLAICIIKLADPGDIIRLFWSRYNPSDVLPFVSGALDILGRVDPALSRFGSTSKSDGAHNVGEMATLPSILGFLVGLYKHCPIPEVSQRWHTAFTFCELLACKRAFDESFIMGENGPRLVETFALWQLIATTTWFVGVCEEFAQNVLRWQASRRWIAPSGADEEFPTSDAYPLIPFVLLPPTLSLFRRILGHVLQIRAIFQGMAPRNQAIVMAKEQLKAAFDASPLQFDEFPSLIRQLEGEASRMLQDGENRKIIQDLLVELTPTARSSLLLTKQATLLAKHPGLQDDAQKTRLLIPLDDLLDIPLVVRRQANTAKEEKDVLTKSMLTGPPALGLMRVCVRCGSRSESRWLDRRTRVPNRSGVRWSNYEYEWEGNCVCGGSWIKAQR